MTVRIFLISAILISSFLHGLAQSSPGDSTLKSERDSLKLALEREPLQLDYSETLIPLNWQPTDTFQYMTRPHDWKGYIQTNNYGSPRSTLREGMAGGNHLQDGYTQTLFFHRHADQLGLYRSNKAMSEVTITQSNFPGRSQSGLIDNLTVNTFLSIPFRNHFHFNFFYDRINFKGSYQHNRNFLSSLASKIFRISPSGKSGFEISLASNTDKLEHNHGIVSDSFLTQSRFRIRETIPVISNSANTRLKNGQYGFSGWLRLAKSNRWFAPILSLSSYYHFQTLRFEDRQPVSSLSQYGRFYSLDSTLVTRDHRIQGLWSHAALDLTSHPDFKIQLYAAYDFNRVQFDSGIYVNIPFVKSGFNSHLNIKPFHLSLQGQLIDQKGRSGSHLHAKLAWKSTKASEISYQMNIDSRIPSLVEQTFYANQRNIWQTDFENVKVISHIVNFNPGKRFLPVFTLSFHDYRGFIFMDTSRNFNQQGASVRHLHLRGSETLQWGWFRSHHEFNVHILNPDPAGWSAWYSYHDMGIETRFFGKFSRLGIAPNLRLLKPGNHMAYHSLTGQYFKSGETSKPAIIPLVGADISLRIEEFKFVLSFDQIDSFWTDGRPSWLPGYPIYDFGMRVTIQWKFIN